MTLKRSIGLFTLSASTLALATPAVAQTDDRDTVEDVIVVQGIRQSLASAADAKRNDSRIIDAIVAEDIGKLPDNNVAEALQRVTGVSINRDFGVGSGVSIRGLPQNRVEINGRSTLGDGRNGINFQDVPAEILGAIEVVKSPTPRMIEGALGGTINLKTLRPLELKDRVLSASAKAEYTDKADNLGPLLGATIGDKWVLGDGSTFGVIGNISYQDRVLREDEYRSSLEVNAIDIDGEDGPAEAENYVDPRNYSTFIGTENRERLAGNIALQWEPASETAMFYLEATATDRSGSDETFSPNIIDNSVIRSQDEIDLGFRIDDTRQIVGFTDNDSILINRTESGFRNTESLSAALGGEWTSGKFDFSAEVSYANSQTENPYSDLRFWGLDADAQAEAQADASPVDPDDFGNPDDILQSLDVTVFYDTDNDSVPTVDLLNPELYLDRSVFAFRRYESRTERIDNEELALRFDATYNEPIAALPLLSSVDVGVRTTNRSFESGRDRLFVGNIQRDLVDTATGERFSIFMEDFPDGVIQDFDFNAFRGNDGPFDLQTFAMFDPAIVRDQERTLGIVRGLLAGTNKADLLDAGQTPELARSSAIDEDTTAAYIQVNLDSQIGAMPVRAVFGTRWVRTDLTSNAFENVGGTFQPTEDTNEYDDWLPSANLTVDVQEDLLVRFAAGKVMRRPDYGQLSPAFNANQDAVFASRGNPQLEPFRATQYDVSIEKYWGEGNLVSLALFYKDVSSFFDETEVCSDAPTFVAISNPNRRDELCFLDGRGGNPVNPNDPGAVPDADSELGIPTEIQVNGASGSVKGFEVGYQQNYDFLPGALSGFGMVANYTYADSEDPNGRPLEDISKNTYNLTGYYEYEGFSARLAYTYRDRFLDDILNGRVRQLGELFLDDSSADPTQGNSFREPIKQLDGSIAYDINENFTILADAVNLTGEQIFDTGTSGSLWRVLESDRRYTLGVRAKF